MNLQNVPVHPSYVNTNRATIENSVLRFTSLGKYSLSIPLSLIGPTPTIFPLSFFQIPLMVGFMSSFEAIIS